MERSIDPVSEENRAGRASSAEYDYGRESDEAEPDRSGPIRTRVEPARLEAEVH